MAPERLGSEPDRFFRLGLAAGAEVRAAPGAAGSEALGAALRALAVPPPAVSLGTWPCDSRRSHSSSSASVRCSAVAASSTSTARSNGFRAGAGRCAPRSARAAQGRRDRPEPGSAVRPTRVSRADIEGPENGKHAPPDRAQPGRPPRSDGRGAPRRRDGTAVGRRALRGDRRSSRADRDGDRAPAGTPRGGSQRHRPRGGRRRGSRSARVATRPRRARASSNGRSSAGCRRRRSRRSRSSPTSARARAPTSRGSAASPPTGRRGARRARTRHRGGS